LSNHPSSGISKTEKASPPTKLERLVKIARTNPIAPAFSAITRQ
jgi:hypothetical protein